MKLILGLGNPGKEYAGTRHNIGRSLIANLADQHGLSFSKKKSLASSVVTFKWESHPVALAYPETFMNVSGEAAHALVQHFDLDLKKDLLVVLDDAALEFGQMRLRSKGSDGGHNGLKSIHQSLGSPDYARLRLGIGHPHDLSAEKSGLKYADLADYVLAVFDQDEKTRLKDFLGRASQACELWVKESISQAMNVVNAVSE